MITAAIEQLDQITKKILEVQQQLKHWKNVITLANCIDVSIFHTKVSDFVGQYRLIETILTNTID
jgi:conjugal transfer/entry exclusion protein